MTFSSRPRPAATEVSCALGHVPASFVEVGAIGGATCLRARSARWVHRSAGGVRTGKVCQIVLPVCEDAAAFGSLEGAGYYDVISGWV